VATGFIENHKTQKIVGFGLKVKFQIYRQKPVSRSVFGQFFIQNLNTEIC
jgi:hypothetical protein